MGGIDRADCPPTTSRSSAQGGAAPRPSPHAPIAPIAPAAPSAPPEPDVYDAGQAHNTRTLRALQALTDTALSHLSLDALLPELLERVQVVMQVDNVAILLLDDATQELVVRAARGPEEAVVGVVRIPLGAGFAGRIAATRQPLVVDDFSTYSVSNPLLREQLHSALGVPLIAGERVVGVVHIDSATPRQFTADEETLLTQVADRIALAVERAQLFAAAEAARALAEQRAAFLSGTLEALGDGLVITDADGRLLYGNPAYSAMLGVATQPGAGNTDSDMSGLPSHVPSRMQALETRDAQGAPIAVEDLGISRVLRGETLTGSNAKELRIRRLDGRDAHLSVTGAPVRDASGAQIGAVMALRDVTERRRLEQQAHEAKRQTQERAARLEAIFSAVADGLFVYGADGHIVERNPAAAAMLATFAPPETHSASVYERNRLIGGQRDTSGRELTEDEWPQTRIARGETLNGFASAYVRMRRADGVEAILNVSGAPLRDENGAIVGSVCLYRDVTAGWQLSESLRRSASELEVTNTQLRTLLDVTPVGVSIVDANGKPLIVNDAVRQIWGQNLLIPENAAEYGGYRAWHVKSGEPVAADEWGLARALNEGVISVGIEYDIETFGGQRKAILDSAAPIRDDTGAITGAVSVIYDITERREYERRTRAALDAVLEMTQTLVALPDDSSAVTSHLTAESPSLATPQATAGEAAHGPAGAETATVITPGEAQSAGGEARVAERLIAQRLAELTAGVLGCKRVGIMAIEPETERLRAVAVVGLTPEQEPQWWAEQRALEAQGARFGDGGDPAEVARFRAGEVFVLDMTQPPLNEAPNPYGVTTSMIAPMRTNERLVGMVSLDFGGPPHAFTDEERALASAVAQVGAVALERDRLLREREAARAEALAMTEAKRRMDEFLGIASHELRTPLTTVKANLQMAQRRAQQAMAAQAQALAAEPEANRAQTLETGPLGQLSLLLGRAAQSATRQERLLEDLLDISRISAGRMEYRMEPIDLAHLTRETVDEQRMNNPRRRIEWREPDEPAAPVRVIADADRIRQAITNYLTNALKYSEDDRPVVVSLRVVGNVARVAVRDQGQGLSAEQQRRVFEQFHRVPGIVVLSGAGVGLGLGLYITKTIIEQHNGRFGVESAPGAGSTFWFTLPIAPTPEAND